MMAIFLIRILMEDYYESKKIYITVLIDLVEDTIEY